MKQEVENKMVLREVLTLDKWQIIEKVAPAMFKARLFGVESPEQAMAIMLKGFECGFSLTAAFEFIQVIQGKPGICPRGALALVQQHPEFAGLVLEETNDERGLPQSCTCTLKRTNGSEYTTSFSMDDARRAGLIKGGGGWEKYPANMLRWRAIGYAIDVVFPDVIGGMKRTDELGAEITIAGETEKPTMQISPALKDAAPIDAEYTDEPKDLERENLLTALQSAVGEVTRLQLRWPLDYALDSDWYARATIGEIKSAGKALKETLLKVNVKPGKEKVKAAPVDHAKVLIIAAIATKRDALISQGVDCGEVAVAKNEIELAKWTNEQLEDLDAKLRAKLMQSIQKKE